METMKTFNIRNVFFILISFIIFSSAKAQIYDPEGINIPGSWDNWTNPPTNPAFSSETQASGNLGLVSTTSNYQTIFSTPDDLVSGSYEFLFTSGSAADYYNNKWTNASFTLNTISDLTFNGADNNTVTLNDNKFYVMNWGNTGYTNTRAIFMELEATPVSITNVSQDIPSPDSDQNVLVTVAADNTPSENVYVRYTTNNWGSSAVVACNFTGTTGTATIPMQVEATEIEYYVFTTSVSTPTSDFDLITINLDNNSGSNYSYTVNTPPVPLSCDGASGVLTSEPVFPMHDGAVTITFDATRGNGQLLDYEGEIYAHTGLITSESQGNNDWQYVISDWGVNDTEFHFTEIDSVTYELSIDNIREFYGVPANEEIYKITMVIRAADPIAPENPDEFLVARNADGSDFHLSVYTAGTNVKIESNLSKDPLVPIDSEIPVCVYAMDATTISLKIDDVEVDQINDLHLMYGLNTGDYTSGMHEIVAIADDGTNFAYDTTWFYIRGDVVIEDLPAGMKNGINYIDETTVTLVLHEPSHDKDFVFAIGDFNNWTASDNGYMKRTPDGDYYWTTITGLTPGTEYAYQYYIDGVLKIADPYCDKILDPWNDRWIPETTYPDLKIYPWDLTLGTVSVLETGQEEYNWVVDDFTPSALGITQSNLIIYELLIRDFVESKDIKDVIDSLDYLQDLGINAIELMPISEFDGNDSWGYAPNFFFAPDKAYGTKNDYKRFIDECHQRGIAVIMDVVYNHMYGGSPFVQMYWDSNNDEPASNSAWFNQQATHPYSIGYDFNHQSGHTRELVKENLTYWMTEYKIDGFRFDLSKGFTQNNSGGDVGAWSAYDQSRIDIIMDYYNHTKWVNSDAYFILEHFADNGEEVVLANAGCMLWGVMTSQIAQTTMGWDSNHDFSSANYSDRGFSYPNLIPFMESHDEERIMHETVTYGNGFANDTTASLKRMEAIASMYMTIPGPKMLWQFEELGYDESIFLCPDGSFEDNCRTSSKPIHWEYTSDQRRKKLYWTYAGMAKLKTENQAFISGSFGQDQGGLGKRMWVSDASMNVSVTANFAANGFDMAPSFQHTGTWYNYFTGESINVTDANGHIVYYNPGDYYVFTDVQLDLPYANLTFNVKNVSGVVIPNATVTITNYGTGNTDGSGNTSFIYGTSTTVNYTVSASGYTSQSGTLSMGGTNQTKNIILDSSIDVQRIDNSLVSMFPNPASHSITVESEELYNISIYDITGKYVKSIQMTSKNEKVDLSGLRSGIYTFTFKNETSIETKKVVIK